MQRGMDSISAFARHFRREPVCPVRSDVPQLVCSGGLPTNRAVELCPDAVSSRRTCLLAAVDGLRVPQMFRLRLTGGIYRSEGACCQADAVGDEAGFTTQRPPCRYTSNYDGRRSPRCGTLLGATAGESTIEVCRIKLILFTNVLTRLLQKSLDIRQGSW